jgi:hypothetical protein
MRVLWLVAALILCEAPLATAQTNDFCSQARAQTQKDPRADAIGELYRVGCLGGEKDDQGSTAQVQRILDTAAKVNGAPVARRDVTLSHEERLATVQRSLEQVMAYLGELMTAANPDDRAELGDVQDALKQASDAIAIDRPAATRATEVQFWKLDQGGPALAVPLLRIPGPKVDLLVLLARGNCDGRPTEPRCTQASSTAEGVVRAATLVERALGVKSDESLLAAYREAKRRDARWNSYFSDVKSQFIWENLVNGQLYQRQIRGKGLSDPPTSQLILFHPNVGMEYVSGADPGDKMKAALVLEVVGYNRWSWGDDNKPQNAFGASAVVTYADRAGVRTAAWGISVIAMNNYALTITRHGGKTGVMLSADLTKAVSKADEDLKQRFRLGL